MGLYLFSGLPLDHWLPSDPYLVIVKQWLLTSDLGSATNQLAQLVLGKINWGTTYMVRITYYSKVKFKKLVWNFCKGRINHVLLEGIFIPRGLFKLKKREGGKTKKKGVQSVHMVILKISKWTLTWVVQVH